MLKIDRDNQSFSLLNTPTLAPITGAGSGSVQEKKKARLSEIIEQLNTLFGSDTTEGAQLSYANAVAEKVLKSEVLQKQAANNSKEQFTNSPDLPSEILTALIDRSVVCHNIL